MNFLSLKSASQTKIERLFLIMTICMIVPLYFEDIRQIFVLVFFLMLCWVGFNLKYATGVVSKVEKTWIAVMVAYASVFILSFILRGNYTEDGSWRVAAPMLILVLSFWYFLSVRFKVQMHLLRNIALVSILNAVLLFIIEIIFVLQNVGHFDDYRYGIYLRDLGATGFILPITFVLLVTMALRGRKKVWFLVALAFVFTALTEARTAWAILLSSVVLLVLSLIFKRQKLTLRVKGISVLLLCTAMATMLWVGKDRLQEAVSDMQFVKQGDFNTSLGLRYAMLDVGVSTAMESPIIGIGPSQYKIALAEALSYSDYSEEVISFIIGAMQIHNQFLMDWLLSGVLGVVSLILFLFYPLYAFLKQKTETSAIALSIGMLLGIVFVMFFGAIFTYTYTTIMYVLAMSALISFFQHEKDIKA